MEVGKECGKAKNSVETGGGRNVSETPKNRT